MTAKLDATPFSVVVWCDECPWFSAGALDRKSGHALRAEHDGATHPGSRVAANTLYVLNRYTKVAQRAS